MSTNEKALFWHRLTPARLHDQTKTEAVNSSSSSTSHAIRDESGTTATTATSHSGVGEEVWEVIDLAVDICGIYRLGLSVMREEGSEVREVWCEYVWRDRQTAKARQTGSLKVHYASRPVWHKQLVLFFLFLSVKFGFVSLSPHSMVRVRVFMCTQGVKTCWSWAKSGDKSLVGGYIIILLSRLWKGGLHGPENTNDAKSWCSTHFCGAAKPPAPCFCARLFSVNWFNW